MVELFGKQYVLDAIGRMSENNSMSVLVTDTKKFPNLVKFREGDNITLEGKIAKIDTPKGADYPYFVIKFNRIK